MEDDDYEPREHDYLVEPMYAGLGQEQDDAGSAPVSGDEPDSPSGLWSAVVRFFSRFRRSSTRDR